MRVVYFSSLATCFVWTYPGIMLHASCTAKEQGLDVHSMSVWWPAIQLDLIALRVHEEA